VGAGHRIGAPALAIGRAEAVCYPRELFEQTAARVHDGRAHTMQPRLPFSDGLPSVWRWPTS